MRTHTPRSRFAVVIEAGLILAAPVVASGCGNSTSAANKPANGSDAGGSKPDASAGTTGSSTGGSSNTGGASSGGGANGGAAGEPIDPACIGVADQCPAPKGGVTIQCRKRFFYGVNYPWKTDPVYGSDFGESNGVSARRATFLADLQSMAAYDVDVVRWWMFGRLAHGFTYTDGVPDGITATTRVDIQEALSAASEAGVHLQLTLFSFDTFKPTNTLSGNRLMRDIVTDPTRLARLMGAVRQVAEAVEASPHKDALASWDIINEPEWATSGQDSGGDKPFEPNSDVAAAPYASMDAFIKTTIDTLRAAHDKPMTVGAAAYAWEHPWDDVGQDFFTFHMYDWVNEWWPYDRSPYSFGVVRKPVVLGEFPIQGLTGVPYKTLLDGIFAAGYAGATAWAMNDNGFDWAGGKFQIKAWAAAHPCITSYGDLAPPSDAGAGDAAAGD